MGARGQRPRRSVSPTSGSAPRQPERSTDARVTQARAGRAARRRPRPTRCVVLDFGGQYSQLIARRVRECGVFSELLPAPRRRRGGRAARRPRALILSGGPASVYADGAPPLDRELLELGVPVLGICYGMQLLALELGGRVEGAEVGEFGRSQLTVREPGPAAAPARPREQTCWMSHRDTVFARAAGVHARWPPRPPRRWPRSSPRSAAIYGIQFHPEVVHTPYGQQVLTQLPRRHLRLRAHAGAPASVDRGADRADPRPGRRRAGDLRPVRRRRLERRRAARAPRDRRPADLRVRRPRADAQERGRAGDRGLPRPLQGAARRRRRRGPVPGAARRASATPSASAS